MSRRRVTLVASMMVLSIACALVACGVNTSTPGTTLGSSKAAASATPWDKRGAAQTPTLPNTPASASNGANGGGCPGGVGAITAAGTPQLVLGTSGETSGSVHPGELVQVRLTATSRWSLHDVATSAGMLQPAGFEDRQHNVCVWNFRPPSTATLSLAFTGTALCTGKLPCPQYVFRETVTIQVK